MEYIYIRKNELWDYKQVIKLGKTKDIYKRQSTYITSEICRGEFILIIEVNKKDNIELLLQKQFKYLNIYNGAGTEFFKYDIIDLIIPFLIEIGIEFKKLNEAPINNYNIKPYDYQQNILDNIKLFYKENKAGKLLWTCGLGKTIMSLLICRYMGYKKILIGVPNLTIQKQFKKEVSTILPDYKIILFNGILTENIDNKKFIIITTYHSCGKINLKFDFKIGDEAHHLIGYMPYSSSLHETSFVKEETSFVKEETSFVKEETSFVKENRKFISFHKIKSHRTLYMTATEKIFLPSSSSLHKINFVKNEINFPLSEIDFGKKNENETTQLISMNDSLFGEVIDRKNITWAIQNNKILDYKIIIPILKHKGYHDLVISLNMVVKILNDISPEHNDKFKKIMLCCNNISSANFAKKYLLENAKNYNYCEALHSKCEFNIKDEIKKFKSSTRGIIINVAMFNEGFNMPILDTVCIVEKIESPIKIIQTVMRCLRLYPEKKPYIILPCAEDEFDKSIIKNLSLYDTFVYNKLEFYKESPTAGNGRLERIINCNKIALLQLRIKNSNILNNLLQKYKFTVAENKIKYGAEFDIQKSKLLYLKKNKCPEEEFKAFWQNWYVFLGVDTTRFLNLEEWRLYCRNNKIKYKNYKEHAQLNLSILPLWPADYYAKFTNIKAEIRVKKIIN